MGIETIDDENYDSVVQFLQNEGENISEWSELLKNGLFRLCAEDENNQIQCIFIFEDYPTSLVNKHDFISRSNWPHWLKNHFEVPAEPYHMLWLTKHYIAKTYKFDTALLKSVLASIFVSYFEFENILLAVDKHDETNTEQSKLSNNFSFQILFQSLHRVHRSKDTDQSKKESLFKEIDLFYCSKKKILADIQVREASAEDFDDLMPLFLEYGQYLQKEHGEFFLAELIESSQNDQRLKTLIAQVNGEPKGFVCFTTNIDLMSIRNAFYLQQFNNFNQIEITPVNEDVENEEFQNKIYNKDEIIVVCESDIKIAEILAGYIMKLYAEKEWNEIEEKLLNDAPDNDTNYIEFIRKSFSLLTDAQYNEIEKCLNDKIRKEYSEIYPDDNIDNIFKKDDIGCKPILHIDTSSMSRPNSAQIGVNNSSIVIVINLLCIDPSYIHATKILAQSIFDYYSNCQYLLATTIHNQVTPNFIDYFSRIYPKPCVEYPYDLYLLDKNGMNASISIREIDWERDVNQLSNVINETVPNRQNYLNDLKDNNIHCYVVIVDYKVVGAIYLSNITKQEIKEFDTLFDLSTIKNHEINENNALKLDFMVLNPIFNVNGKGILKEILRQTEIDILFYNYIPEYIADNIPNTQSVVIENFIQMKPRQFVYKSSQSTYSLSIFVKEFYKSPPQMINHRIVIIGHNDDSAYGLIEYFITQNDLRFTNLTLITTINKYKENYDNIKSNTLLHQSNINGNYLQKLCINNKLQIISDTINGLEVDNKCIVLKESGVCPYDILVFATGLGAVPIIPQLKYSTIKKRSLESLLQHTLEYNNILTVSPDIKHDIEKLETYFTKYINDLNENIVIYGDFISSICIVNYLISQLNINGNRIIIIESLSSSSKEFYFKNDILKTMILKQLKNIKVRFLENVYPVGFIEKNNSIIDAVQLLQNGNKEINAMIIEKNQENDIQSIDESIILNKKYLKTGLSYYSLSCSSLILCQKEIDLNILNATNQNPFVIDGQIVVDNEFKTQDPTIYAIGSVAKFSRKYNNNISLQYTNSFDIGKQAANIIVNDILEDKELNDNIEINLQQPTSITAKLPGGYHYFCAYNPKYSRNTQSKTESFEQYSDNQFNQITFNSAGYLIKIIYYGTDWKEEYSKCSSLINIHSSLLNNIQKHFDDKIVNICCILNEEQYKVMYDERFKNWVNNYYKITTQKKTLDEIRVEMQHLIQSIIHGNQIEQ